MKTILALVVLVGILFLAGCASHSDNFDPSFSSEEVASIEAGFAEWPRQEPVQVIRVTGNSTTNDCVQQGANPSQTFEGGTIRGNAAFQTKICLYVDAIAVSGVVDALQQTAAHEMGHALGLNHAPTDGPDSLMKAEISDDAHQPTAFDLANLSQE